MLMKDIPVEVIQNASLTDLKGIRSALGSEPSFPRGKPPSKKWLIGLVSRMIRQGHGEDEVPEKLVKQLKLSEPELPAPVASQRARPRRSRRTTTRETPPALPESESDRLGRELADALVEGLNEVAQEDAEELARRTRGATATDKLFEFMREEALKDEAPLRRLNPTIMEWPIEDILWELADWVDRRIVEDPDRLMFMGIMTFITERISENKNRSNDNVRLLAQLLREACENRDLPSHSPPNKQYPRTPPLEID